MKTADELFKELGYEKYGDEEKSFEITYTKTENIYTRTNLVRYINFDTELKMYNFAVQVEENEYTVTKLKPNISMQELKAINKKCRELGWIE